MGAVKQMLFELVKSECEGCGKVYKLERAVTNECYDLGAKVFTHPQENCPNDECEMTSELARLAGKDD